MADEDKYQHHRQLLTEIFNRTLERTAPERLVRDVIEVESDGIRICDHHYPLLKDQHIWVFGTGKASSRMALALEGILGDRIKDGIVISPYSSNNEPQAVQQFQGSHPIPGRDSESATYELLNLTKKIPADDIVLFCISGGTSSLLCMPAKGIELEELQETHQLLIRSGANIKEINTVRKHISEIKGGQLLHTFKDTRLVDLVISDVPGDSLEDIGSGPTIPDSTTFQKAFQILKKYRLWEEVPHNIRTHIAKGMHHEIPETPKPGSDILLQHRTHIIGSSGNAARVAAQIAEDKGYNAWIDQDVYTGDVQDISSHITDHLLSTLDYDDPVAKPAALIFYGESTVEVTGNGLGGRNQELALQIATGIEKRHHISLLSAGTDGKDGPTDAAGAFCNGSTAHTAKQHDLIPDDFLRNNDSYHFFDALDLLLKTGPTGNNVMDLQIAIVERDST